MLSSLLVQNTTAPSLQEKKNALVRDTIWQAAIDLFAEKGFDQTTVDDIATAAGTSRRSFFRYFESKRDLMAQGIVSYGAALMDTILSCPEGHSPVEVVRHTVLSVARESASHPRTRTIMAIAAKYPAARDAQIARIAEVQDKVAEAFGRHFERDSADRTLARVLAAITLSALNVTYQIWFESRQTDIAVTVEQVLATFCDVSCGASTPVQRITQRAKSKRSATPATLVTG